MDTNIIFLTNNHVFTSLSLSCDLLLLLLQLYFNTEPFHNIKLTKYIQRENKMSDLPIGRLYKNYYYFRLVQLKLIFETLDVLRSFKITR